MSYDRHQRERSYNRPEPEGKAPESRPDLTTISDVKMGVKADCFASNGKHKLLHGACHNCKNTSAYCCSRCIRLSNSKTSKTIMETQSFDSLIMECQDILSIEGWVEKKYKKWLAGKYDKKKPIFKIEKISGSVLKYSFPVLLLSLIILPVCINAGIQMDKETWSGFFGFSTFMFGGLSVIGIVFGVVFSVGSINKISVSLSRFKKHHKNPSERIKYQFAKEGYIGTKNKLNSTLDKAKQIVRDRIEAHQKDKTDILEFSDMLGDTKDATNRINKEIKGLEDDHKRLSDKQNEINKVIDGYIGETGILAQKEKDLARILKAQEISSKMEENFKITMEVRQGVDIIVDTIIPGLKQLMSFKIPELIEDITYQCDKSKSYLEIKR